jgi:hypothetical protein
MDVKSSRFCGLAHYPLWKSTHPGGEKAGMLPASLDTLGGRANVLVERRAGATFFEDSYI